MMVMVPTYLSSALQRLKNYTTARERIILNFHFSQQHGDTFVTATTQNVQHCYISSL